MSAAANKNWSLAGRNRANATDLVFGIGATGLSIARYLKREGIAARFADTRSAPPALGELTELDPDAGIVLGDLPDDLLQDVLRIIVSPGVPDRQPLLVAARRAGIEILSDIELFVRAAQAPVVAVTGSNGKSTVTTLLFQMCEAAGLKGLAGGNLGVPALDLLEFETPDYYVLELSSFHLQRTAHLPLKVAVLLNISPDHLDWHASEDEYRRAKYRILQEASAAVVNRAGDDPSEHLAAGARCVSFGLDTPATGQFGLIGEGSARCLARGEQALLPVADLALVGTHNQANALAALAAGELMGLDMPSMLRVLTEFTGLPHRMQFVARIGDVDYINDSKATNVGAAIAAVESVAGPVVLIAGGQGKGGDFDALAKAISARLRLAILFGEDAPAIESALAGLAPTTRVVDLGAAVRSAAEHAEPGDTVLLAPACASFDQFANFKARGDAFRNAVLELGA
jgi:UDP-N-acetylmuramoylalanine--D-glutamate ligase